MKLLMYRFGTRKNSQRNRQKNSIKFNLERSLYLAFVATFALLLIVQAALLNPSIRTFLTASTELEGKPLSTEEFLYEQGTIALELQGEEGIEEVKVLKNGDEVAAFSNKVVNLTVKDGDVIEIDGSLVLDDVVVTVISTTENISSSCTNAKIKVQSDVQKLIDVKME